MMDKLRRALSGNDGEDEERGFVAQVLIYIYIYSSIIVEAFRRQLLSNLILLFIECQYFNQ
jgi:hypothetical protein